MKKTLFICFLLLCFGVKSQENATLSGYVKDIGSGEELIGAYVVVEGEAKGTVTNVYGFYSLTLPKGEYTLSYSYVGYDKTTKKINLIENKVLDVELMPFSEKLDEIVVTSEAADKNVTSTQMSIEKLDIGVIETIPALFGEVDVIKSIQLLPGVSTVGEGASGFNVRGGSVDQNLILLDEAPVYNSSHMFGFFSVFNPDAVKGITLQKGGIPAQYGGRVSSILDVRMKDGNKKKFSGSGGIGAIFSRLTLEGPIQKNKSSFILSGRRSYIDVLAKPFLKGDLKNAAFNFYDLTAKVNFDLGEKDRIFLSGYFGRDVFGADFSFNWGNATTTARWNHVFNNKTFFNFTAFYSKYDYELGVGEQDVDAFSWNSNIINYSLKPEFSWFANTNNTIRFGGQVLYNDFRPGSASFYSGGASNDIGLDSKYALESAVYVSNEQKIGARVALNYGIRYSLYHYLGKGTAYVFGTPDTPASRKPLEDVITYDARKTIQQYDNFEPRFSIRYKIDDVSSLKGSYNKTAQYVHLVSNTSASTPLDVWTPSTNNLKPQVGNQYTVGYFRNLKENTFEISTELYYKEMQNQLDYIPDANLILNELLEGDLLSGDGRAYGLEFMVKKTKGKLTGWLSYTLARSERRVEGINNEDWYPNRFDKKQETSLVLNYDLKKRWEFSANFVYASGTPTTFPTNKYYLPSTGSAVPHNYGNNRNNIRIPAYHRLDVSATRQGKKKEGRNWEYFYVFSVYNLYNRNNPFSIFFRPVENGSIETEAVRYTIIGSFIPAVSFNFKF